MANLVTRVRVKTAGWPRLADRRRRNLCREDGNDVPAQDKR